MSNARSTSDIESAPTAAIFHDAVFIEDLRNQMQKFAVLQVRDVQLAEDAVQEAMISAYQNIERFARKSAFKTWVFSILKTKSLICFARKNAIQQPLS